VDQTGQVLNVAPAWAPAVHRRLPNPARRLKGSRLETSRTGCLRASSSAGCSTLSDRPSGSSPVRQHRLARRAAVTVAFQQIIGHIASEIAHLEAPSAART